MAISLVAVGGKITAALVNLLIGGVNAQGQTSVIPTSVAGSGVSVGTSGKVTFTGATTISVNGCFTSTYDNYTILLDVPTTSASGGVLFQFRSAGVDSTAANYDRQLIYGFAATTVGQQVLAGTSWGISGLTGGATHSADLRLFGPALAQATRCLSTSMYTANPMTASTAAIQTAALLHRLTSAFDGFTITATTGTLTGNLRIVGHNNG